MILLWKPPKAMDNYYFLYIGKVHYKTENYKEFLSTQTASEIGIGVTASHITISSTCQV